MPIRLPVGKAAPWERIVKLERLGSAFIACPTEDVKPCFSFETLFLEQRAFLSPHPFTEDEDVD